eukprot:COSAG06_NODE_1888_length_8136_cov_87.834889_3_plen_103_part_00
MFSPEQVLVHGGAMSLGPLKDSAPAILDCFYGGEEAAQAMADVLFGDYNPSGEYRSWPRHGHVVVTRPYVCCIRTGVCMFHYRYRSEFIWQTLTNQRSLLLC